MKQTNLLAQLDEQTQEVERYVKIIEELKKEHSILYTNEQNDSHKTIYRVD